MRFRIGKKYYRWEFTNMHESLQALWIVGTAVAMTGWMLFGMWFTFFIVTKPY